MELTLKSTPEKYKKMVVKLLPPYWNYYRN